MRIPASASFVLSTWTIAMLSACGGGGGSSNAAPTGVASGNEAVVSNVGDSPVSTTTDADSDSADPVNSIFATTGIGSPTSGPSPDCSKGRAINATPSDYKSKLAALKPGDRLVLAAGTYQDSPPGLPIFNLNGTATQPIVITGPATGRATLIGTSTHNTIRFDNASYVTVCNLEIDGRNQGGFGVANQGVSHHITIDGLYIHGVGSDQQIVGISTTGHPTWNWTIRRNRIYGAGTGMYLGNSDGTDAFVGGLIEYNLILDSIGYNAQIKYQNDRSGIPREVGPAVTTIRHNTFSKSGNSSTGEARPNLLVDHFPLSGTGSTDRYEIYNNFFWQNPTEALFQGNGNVAFYNNILVNDSGPGAVFQSHDGGNPRNVNVFANTILARTTGVSISGGDSGYTRRVVGNAIYAGTPINASGASIVNNSTGPRADASKVFNAANGTRADDFNLYPKAGSALQTGTPFDLGPFGTYTGYNRDFNYASRDGRVRGAYAGTGTNPGWRLSLTRQP